MSYKGAADGTNLLSECSRIYSSLNHYEDKGRVELQEEGGYYTALLFETNFTRTPLRFSFKFAEPLDGRLKDLRGSTYDCGIENDRYYFNVTDSDGKTTVKHQPTLGLVVAQATGLSFGASQHIARLLFPEIGGFTFTEMRSPKIESAPSINGVKCLQISGRHPFTEGIRIILEEDSLVLREYWEKSAATDDWTVIRKQFIKFI